VFVSPLGSAGTVVTPVTSVVTLTGATISAAGINRVIIARLTLVPDGTTWRYTHLGSQQINAATDWMIPNEDASPLYEFRYTNHVGDALSYTGDISVEGTWVDMSEARHLGLRESRLFQTSDCTFDLEVRLDGGDVLATAEYHLTAHHYGL